VCRDRLNIEFLTDNAGVSRDDDIIGCLLASGGVFKVTVYQSCTVLVVIYHRGLF